MCPHEPVHVEGARTGCEVVIFGVSLIDVGGLQFSKLFFFFFNFLMAVHTP